MCAVHFKVKKTTTFKKIFDAYLQRVGKAPGSLRFMFDGKRVDVNATPASLDMDDGDLIEASVRDCVFGRAHLPLLTVSVASSRYHAHPLRVHVSQFLHALDAIRVCVLIRSCTHIRVMR